MRQGAVRDVILESIGFLRIERPPQLLRGGVRGVLVGLAKAPGHLVLGGVDALVSPGSNVARLLEEIMILML